MNNIKAPKKPLTKNSKKEIKIKQNSHSIKEPKLKSNKTKKPININKKPPVHKSKKSKQAKKTIGTARKKKINENNKPSIMEYVAAAIIGGALAGVIIAIFIYVHSYKEKRYIETAVNQLKEADPNAFIAANKEYIFWIKDKSIMLKNIEGKVMWEIPILADEFNILHEEPNLVITYNIDDAVRVERYNNTGELSSILIEDRLVDIKTNRLGEVAVLTEDKEKAYSLKIYDIDGSLKKELLRIDSEEFGFPTGISISPKGKKAAISVVNTISPIVTSNVSIIDVMTGKTVEGNIFRDSIAYEVIFSNETTWEILKK